jgi:hypothetical protein
MRWIVSIILVTQLLFLINFLRLEDGIDKSHRQIKLLAQAVLELKKGM